MEYTHVIRRKLISLTQYLKELEPYKNFIISEKNLPPPKDYYSSFEIVGSVHNIFRISTIT